jgi:hypothetical protein
VFDGTNLYLSQKHNGMATLEHNNHSHRATAHLKFIIIIIIIEKMRHRIGIYTNQISNTEYFLFRTVHLTYTHTVSSNHTSN